MRSITSSTCIYVFKNVLKDTKQEPFHPTSSDESKRKNTEVFTNTTNESHVPMQESGLQKRMY